MKICGDKFYPIKVWRTLINIIVAPNYMVVAADVLTVMPYLKGWTAAPAGVVNRPYFAG